MSPVSPPPPASRKTAEAAHCARGCYANVKTAVQSVATAMIAPLVSNVYYEQGASSVSSSITLATPWLGARRCRGILLSAATLAMVGPAMPTQRPLWVSFTQRLAAAVMVAGSIYHFLILNYLLEHGYRIFDLAARLSPQELAHVRRDLMPGTPMMALAHPRLESGPNPAPANSYVLACTVLNCSQLAAMLGATLTACVCGRHMRIKWQALRQARAYRQALIHKSKKLCPRHASSRSAPNRRSAPSSSDVTVFRVTKAASEHVVVAPAPSNEVPPIQHAETLLNSLMQLDKQRDLGACNGQDPPVITDICTQMRLLDDHDTQGLILHTALNNLAQARRVKIENGLCVLVQRGHRKPNGLVARLLLRSTARHLHSFFKSTSPALKAHL